MSVTHRAVARESKSLLAVGVVSCEGDFTAGDAVELVAPDGAAFAKGLTLKMGQTHMHKYMPRLLERIERGEIDPGFIITHRVGLDDVPHMYHTFRDKQDHCIKVVIKPGEKTAQPQGHAGHLH